MKLAQRRKLWLTGSNLAYPVAGLWSEDAHFATLMVIMGLASGYMHAGGKHGNHVDVAAVYACLFFIIGIMWGLPPIYVLPGALAAGTGLRRFTLDIPMEHKVIVIAGLMLLFGFLSGAPLLVPTLVFAGALAVRQWVDHGAWHILSAWGLSLTHHALK